VLGDLLAQAAERAAKLRDQAALGGHRGEQRLQPLARRRMAGLDRGELRGYLLGAGVDHGGHDVALRLEVVVHVAHGDAGGLRDVRDGRGLHAVGVEHRDRGGDQPLALAAFPNF
jgi:hypothetical protein